MRDDRQTDEGQRHDRVDAIRHTKRPCHTLDLVHRLLGLRRVKIGHQSRNGQRQRRDCLSAVDNAHPALHGDDRIGRRRQLLVRGARHDEVVAVMRNRDGHRAVLQPVALEPRETYMPRVVMALDDRHLAEPVAVIGCPALLGRQKFPLHKADDRGAALNGKVLRRKRCEIHTASRSRHERAFHLTMTRRQQRLIHRSSGTPHRLDGHSLHIVQQHQIGEIPRRDRAHAPQTEIIRRTERRRLVAQRRRRTEGNGLADNAVDMTVAHEVAGVLVVCHQHTARGRLWVTKQRQERPQIVRGRPVPYHNALAEAQLRHRLRKLRALMVAHYTGRHISVERPPRETGRMTVHRLETLPRLLHAGEYRLITRRRADVIHHLRQPQHPPVIHQKVDVLTLKGRAGLVKRRGRHAARQHDEHLQRKPLRRLKHILHAVRPHHIGDLVRVGHDRAGPLGQHDTGELRRRYDARFKVDMTVDKGRDKRLAAAIQLPLAVIFADTDDVTVAHRHIRPFKAAGEYVEIIRIFEDQLRPPPSRSRINTLAQAHSIPSR